jgi:hypothetical protein
MSTLTTANSAATLIVRGLFPVPQNLQGYSTDDSFMAEDVKPGEVQMGVDGLLSAGYVPYPTEISFTFQADSPSTNMFDVVLGAQVSAKEMFIFDGTIILQGTGEKYAMTKGYLTSATPMSGGKKTLQPRKFTITFEKVTKAPS